MWDSVKEQTKVDKCPSYPTGHRLRFMYSDSPPKQAYKASLQPPLVVPIHTEHQTRQRNKRVVQLLRVLVGDIVFFVVLEMI